MRIFNVLLWTLLFSTLVQAQSEEPTPVGVDTVNQQPMSQTIPVIGRLVSLQSGVVSARTGGPVAKLRVDVGDHLQRNDVIAVLDQARLQARLVLAEAEIKEFKARQLTAIATEKLARQDLNRLERLRNTAAFNQSLYDTRVQELAVARSSLREAEARIIRGQASLKLAQIELRDSTVRAPFPGIVTLRQASEGAWLRVGDPVITLLNDQALEVEADVPAERLAGIVAGASVDILLDNSRHTAVVRAIVPDENPAARTRPVRFVPKFSKTPNLLAANQPITLLLPAGAPSEVVSVHKDAVLRKGGKAIVYLVENGIAKPRAIELGEAVGSRLRVLEGLTPGDVVVIRGNERLRPGQNVSYPGQPPLVKSSQAQS